MFWEKTLTWQFHKTQPKPKDGGPKQIVKFYDSQYPVEFETSVPFMVKLFVERMQNFIVTLWFQKLHALCLYPSLNIKQIKILYDDLFRDN